MRRRASSAAEHSTRRRLQRLCHMVSGGTWITFIGWFLDSAATAQAQQATIQGLLAGHRVSQATRSHGDNVPAELTLQRLVDEHVLGGGAHCFLVNRADNTVGLMTLHRITSG